MNAPNEHRLFSVVIPSRNRCGYLAECLQSLHQEIEECSRDVHVIDDGSDCHNAQCNREICGRLNISYTYVAHGRGVAQAREEGRRRATGRWIAFLDDDVRVEPGWGAALSSLLQSIPAGIVGIEGYVMPEGDGLWDREVRNTTGHLFLTCHCIYRGDALERAGGFDARFRHPFAEDHELASRIRHCGAMVFAPSLRVTHMARKELPGLSVRAAASRIHHLLNAEYAFYRKRPSEYRLFRHSPTFWRTYGTMLLRHTDTTLRRRSLRQFIRHPLQAGILVFQTAVEQAVAWVLLPCFLLKSAGHFLASREWKMVQ